MCVSVSLLKMNTNNYLQSPKATSMFLCVPYWPLLWCPSHHNPSAKISVYEQKSTSWEFYSSKVTPEPHKRDVRLVCRLLLLPG